MKFSKKLWLCVILMFMTLGAFAQGFVENALLFSRTRPGGSARVQALGGAQVALGGDFSSALSNPAGLGMYNRSEFTFTPALNSFQTDATHLGTKSNDSKNVFNIPGLSYVHHLPMEKNGFLGGSFGVSMTRINDFNNKFNYHGTDDVSSIINSFEDYAAGYATETLPNPYDDIPLLSYDLPEGLAYLTYLITPISEDPNNTSPVLPDDYINYFSELDTIGNETRSLDRSQNVTTKGAQYQWSFAYGGNYQDKLFFGGSLGITTLRYKFSTSYRESNFEFSSNVPSPLDALALDEDILIDGTGVNLTLGLIYRPVNFAQVGISFVTPTYYELRDTYDARLRTYWNIRSDQDESSEQLVSEYTITTPSKLTTGAAFFLGKYGFITGDVEFVNYNKAKYGSNTPDVTFKPENKDIKKYYTDVVNYRIGAEFRYNIFRLRGGYSIQNNPYKKKFDVDQKVTTVSAGAGIKFSKFFVDATWLTSKWNGSYSQYALSNGQGPVAELKTKMNSGMITVGFTF
jgi:hypothetical protein